MCCVIVQTAPLELVYGPTDNTNYTIWSQAENIRSRPEEWEESLRTKVGLPIEGRMPAKPGCATVSGSGDGWDDSDYWGNGC